MSKFLRLLALSLFVTTSALFVGCNGTEESGTTTDDDTTSEVQGDTNADTDGDIEAKTDTVASADMVLVSLNVPAMT